MPDVNGRRHEYPPAEWAFDDVAEALHEANGTAPLRPLREEATWERLRDDELLGRAVANSIETAEDVRDEPIPTCGRVSTSNSIGRATGRPIRNRCSSATVA